METKYARSSDISHQLFRTVAPDARFVGSHVRYLQVSTCIIGRLATGTR